MVAAEEVVEGGTLGAAAGPGAEVEDLAQEGVVVDLVAELEVGDSVDQAVVVVAADSAVDRKILLSS